MANKYRNIKTRCLSRHLHDSKLEAHHCNRLLAKVQNLEISSYETQKTFHFYVNGFFICKHKVDFLVIPLKGKRYVDEVKGMETREWKMKKKLFEAIYTDIEYRVIKE